MGKDQGAGGEIYGVPDDCAHWKLDRPSARGEADADAQQPFLLVQMGDVEPLVSCVMEGGGEESPCRIEAINQVRLAALRTLHLRGVNCAAPRSKPVKVRLAQPGVNPIRYGCNQPSAPIVRSSMMNATSVNVDRNISSAVRTTAQMGRVR